MWDFSIFRIKNFYSTTPTSFHIRSPSLWRENGKCPNTVSYLSFELWRNAILDHEKQKTENSRSIFIFYFFWFGVHMFFFSRAADRLSTYIFESFAKRAAIARKMLRNIIFTLLKISRVCAHHSNEISHRFSNASTHSGDTLAISHIATPNTLYVHYYENILFNFPTKSNVTVVFFPHSLRLTLCAPLYRCARYLRKHKWNLSHIVLNDWFIIYFDIFRAICETVRAIRDASVYMISCVFRTRIYTLREMEAY